MSGNNSNNNSNSNGINASNRKRRKRGYKDITFLNRSPAPAAGDGAPPRKKHKTQRKYTRTDVSGSVKYKVIKWLRAHPKKSARQAKERFEVELKNVSERAIQKWRKMNDNEVEKLHQSKTKRIRDQSIGYFPTIEKEMLRRREERVQKNRDRSQKWFEKEAKKLLKDDEKLQELGMFLFAFLIGSVQI